MGYDFEMSNYQQKRTNFPPSSHRHFRLVSSAKFVDVGQRHFRYIVPKDNGYVTEKVTLEVFFKTLPSYYDDVPRESMMILKWNYH